MNREVNYIDFRSRQIEGSIDDPSVGVWPITADRVMCGWGMPPQGSWPDTGQWPPSEPPGIDDLAKPNRIHFYIRIQSSAECLLALQQLWPVNVGLHITEDWRSPLGGVLSIPRADEPRIGAHAVVIIPHPQPGGFFHFPNTWGDEWGDRGWGKMPFALFDQTLIEAWACFGLGIEPVELRPGINVIHSGIQDPLRRVLHVFEVVDSKQDERIAWAFAVEESTQLRVEELFVRPRYRGRGYGRSLLRGLKQASTNLHRRLEFWVPYADSEPDRLSNTNAFFRRAGFTLAESSIPTVPYIATKRKGGSGDLVVRSFPPKPTYTFAQKQPAQRDRVPGAMGFLSVDVRPRKTAPSFLGWAYDAADVANEESTNHDEVATEIHIHVDELLSSGDFAGCNRLLEQAEPRRLGTLSIIAFLSATKPVAEGLAARSSFLKRAAEVLQRRHPDHALELLRGFE